ncbi:MAG: 2,4-dichlorophenol 6-monooxygenase [Pseudomonadota bacterium]
MGSFTPSTIPGCRAPHFWLANGQSLYDLFGKGYSLLRFDASADAQELLDAAQAQGIPMTLIDLSAEPNLPEAYQHKLVLCRTDQHVVWRGDSPPTSMPEFTNLLRGKSLIA